MRPSLTILLPAFSALTVAAPAWPDLDLKAALPSQGLDAISEYFNFLAQQVQVSKGGIAPECNPAQAKLPVAPSPLPSPAEGLTVKHVAIGRGTQNYTCDVTNSTAVPQAVGAVAVLFDATCIASIYPSLLSFLPPLALSFNLTNPDVLLNAQAPEAANNHLLGPTNLAISGVHFFNGDKEPFFNLGERGQIAVSKNASTAAPADASMGQEGESAVSWLRLLSKRSTGNLREVFRVGTAGGSAPKTCEGMKASFEIEYGAEYWFFEGPEPKEEGEL